LLELEEFSVFFITNLTVVLSYFTGHLCIMNMELSFPDQTINLSSHLFFIPVDQILSSWSAKRRTSFLSNTYSPPQNYSFFTPRGLCSVVTLTFVLEERQEPCRKILFFKLQYCEDIYMYAAIIKSK